ncbi:hypothetical protein [Streptomyces sp. NBC_00354]|uniref:hypothetical protein n=1 Tax=Streptomyces sp. NBC_00354 TaxID=2975723 RepID=UPI002E270D84
MAASNRVWSRERPSATRNRGRFPSEQATLKVLYLAVREQINPEVRGANHVAAHWEKRR